MGCVIRRAKLACKQAGQGLHLIAAGEEGKLFGISGANLGEALGQQLKSLFPSDHVKLTRTALAATLAQQGLRQARGRDLLHDARRALGADYALIERVLWVAIDIAHLGAIVALAQMHTNAAATSTHVAGGALDLGIDCGRRRGQRVVQRFAREELEHGLVSLLMCWPQ